MTVITCPDCSQKVFGNAPTCYYCGRSLFEATPTPPIAAREIRSWRLGALVATVVLLYVLAIVIGAQLYGIDANGGTQPATRQGRR